MELWQKGQATGEIWPASSSESEPPDRRSPTLVALFFVPSINHFVRCVSGLPPRSQDKENSLITLHTRDGKYWVRLQTGVAQIAFKADNLKINLPS